MAHLALGNQFVVAHLGAARTVVGDPPSVVRGTGFRIDEDRGLERALAFEGRLDRAMALPVAVPRLGKLRHRRRGGQRRRDQARQKRSHVILPHVDTPPYSASARADLKKGVGMGLGPLRNPSGDPLLRYGFASLNPSLYERESLHWDRSVRNGPAPGGHPGRAADRRIVTHRSLMGCRP